MVQNRDYFGYHYRKFDIHLLHVKLKITGAELYFH
jgi:hypothetical protein